MMSSSVAKEAHDLNEKLSAVILLQAAIVDHHRTWAVFSYSAE